jgi:hypothetical protein
VQAQLGAILTNLGARFRLAFDLRLDVDPGAWPDLTTVGVAQVLTGGFQVEYEIGPGTSQVNASSGGAAPVNTSAKVPLPALATWVRVTIAYDGAAGVTFAIADQPPVAIPQTALGATTGDVKFIVGVVYVNQPGTATMQLNVDNVVVRGG